MSVPPPNASTPELRVVMVVQRLRPYYSGQGIQVEELCKQLGPRNVAVTIVTAALDPFPRIEEANGYRVRRLRSDVPRLGIDARRTRLWMPWFGLRTMAYLWRHRHSIDVVHIHALTDALYGAWLVSRLCRIPVMFEMTYTGHDDPLSVQQSRNWLRRLRYSIYRRCDGYVAISPALADRYRRAGLPEDRLRIIPQGVDAERFEPTEDRSALRRELGLPTDAPVLISVGALLERKGLDRLLEAWRRIHAEVPDARFLLLGREPFEEEADGKRFLQEQLAALPDGAARNLQMLGVRDDVERWLQAADLFLFASRTEGFGTVVVEAMACGLPCVVAELPGITDFIFHDDGSDGIVVRHESSEAIAGATVAVLRDRDRAAAIGSAARARALDTFGFGRLAPMYIDFYRELIRSKEKPR